MCIGSHAVGKITESPPHRGQSWGIVLHCKYVTRDQFCSPHPLSSMLTSRLGGIARQWQVREPATNNIELGGWRGTHVALNLNEIQNLIRLREISFPLSLPNHGPILNLPFGHGFWNPFLIIPGEATNKNKFFVMARLFKFVFVFTQSVIPHPNFFHNWHLSTLLGPSAGGLAALRSGHSRVTVGSQSGHSRVMVFAALLCSLLKDHNI